MAKVREINQETLQNVVKNLAHHWKYDNVMNFISIMDYLKKKYSADITNQILVHLKWEIEGGE